MTGRSEEFRAASMSQKWEELLGQPHPDYPIQVERSTTSHAEYVAPDIHGHRVTLRWPLGKSGEWVARYQAHDGSWQGWAHLGPEGDAHSHMRYMWHELNPNPGLSLGNSDIDLERMMDEAMRNPGRTATSREFGPDARRLRGMN